MTFNGYCFDVGTHDRVEGVKKRKNEKEAGREVDVRGTTEWSSRAERAEEGLEVEKPGGQTGSQSARETQRKEGETESKHRQGRTQGNIQTHNHAGT